MAVHCYPVNDEKGHLLNQSCACNPRVEWQDPFTGRIYPRGPVVIHNAYDCREACERALGVPVSSSHHWKTEEV